jgi:hypothetical protein
MRKEDYQDVMWLFHELGECLRSKNQDASKDWDTRALLREVIENHQSTFFGGRNPFNWLKELQTTLNFWHHLQLASEVSVDDLWRDLDTLERVARYLALDSAFVESVRNVKERILVDRDQSRQPNQDDIRSWIREEVSQQLEPTLASQQGPTRVQARGDAGAQRQETPVSQERGAHADRVRSFVIDTYIEPARTEGQKEVRVRAGDVDKSLGYQYRRLPLICAALRSEKFLAAARVGLRSESGPPSGASTTTTFTYELLK